jgi:hypothetical protein
MIGLFRWPAPLFRPDGDPPPTEEPIYPRPPVANRPPVRRRPKPEVAHA